MLGAALVFVTLFRRLKLGATLGYIVAGALIGPHVLGLIRDPEQLTSVTEIGIALLLFIVGLELQPSRLWRLRKDIFGLGLAQVVLCGARASALLLYVALGISPEAALAIGLPLGLSSTAQVLPMLRVRQRAEHAAGRARLLDPAVPGPRDRSDDHDHRRDGARRARPERARRVDARALHRARGHRPGPASAASSSIRCSGWSAASASASCSSSPACSRSSARRR